MKAGGRDRDCNRERAQWSAGEKNLVAPGWTTVFWWQIDPPRDPVGNLSVALVQKLVLEPTMGYESR